MATKIFRFALGTPDAPHSGLWRLWTHEDEIRATVRTARDEIALIAYPTGRWRITKGSDISKWDRPKEFRPGWTQGPELVIPYSAVPIRSAADSHPTEPLTWLIPPALGYFARFTLLFAGQRAEQSRWRPSDTPGTQHLTILPLRTLGTLHVDRIDQPIDPENMPVAAVTPATVSLDLDVIVSADHTGRPSLWEIHNLQVTP